MVDIASQRGKWFFLLKVFVGVLLSCFQSVFQSELELLNSVDILSLQGAFGIHLVLFESFLLRNLLWVASGLHLLLSPSWPLMGGKMYKCVYWNVSVGLKCVPMTRINMLLKLSPLYTIVSRNVTLSSEISAVNLIVAWWLFACSMKCVISSLPVSQRAKMLPI